jgi:DNA-directed RNA polymerase subunit F
MHRAMFANFNSHSISLKEAKQILNRNGNAYSDEEVKKILEYLHALAELEVEHVENQNESTHLTANRNDSFAMQHPQTLSRNFTTLD